jgi:hypothetical protein
MKRFLLSAMLAWGLAATAAAAPAAPDEVRLARVLAGIAILRSANLESGPEKLARFKQLKKITGLDNARMTALIDRYKNDPEGWDRIMQLVRTLVENQ